MYFPIENKLNFFKTCFTDSIHLRRMPILSRALSNKLTHYFAFKYRNILKTTQSSDHTTVCYALMAIF